MPSAAPVYAKGFDGLCASRPKLWRRRIAAFVCVPFNRSQAKTRPAITFAPDTAASAATPPQNSLRSVVRTRGIKYNWFNVVLSFFAMGLALYLIFFVQL